MTARRRVAATVLAAATLLVGAGCGGDDDGTQGPDGKLTGELADGRDGYARYCASCHGVDLRGTSRGPSQLSEVYQPSHHPDGAYRAAVANGVPPHHWEFGPMPPIPSLGGDEVDAIIAYIRHVQEREGFESYPP